MASEEEKAKAAAAKGESGPTIFDKIVSKQIPAKVIYEDDDCMAFHDVAPQAPTHFLVIPKHKDGLTRLCRATPSHKELLGHLLLTASECAKKLGLEEGGYRVVVNDGPHGC